MPDLTGPNISSEVLKNLLSEFTDFLREMGAPEFGGFDRSEYIEREENYKKSIYEQAKRQLRSKDWTEDLIGTGEIQKDLAGALFDHVYRNGHRYVNNLVDWRKVASFKAMPPSDAMEGTILSFFKNRISNAQAFAEFLSFGLEYQLIAYLFFIKDASQFVPIAQETFDLIIEKKLQIRGFRTSRNASWENYKQYLDLIRETRQFLRTRFGDVNLIDAHTFLWILGRQREAWIANDLLGADLTSEVSRELSTREGAGTSFDDSDVERDDGEPTHFLQYWLPDQVQRDRVEGRPLDHVGSNQYERKKVRRGDTVWIVTVTQNGVFCLVGRVVVDAVVSLAQTREIFPDDEVFDRRMHIVSGPSNAELMQEVEIDDIAEQLRFKSKMAPKLVRVAGRIDGKQLQTIRTLEARSAAILERRWTPLDVSSSVFAGEDDQEEERIKGTALPELEKLSLIRARRGQGLFRSNLALVEKGCRLTGVMDKRVLIASHIKPWRYSTAAEKLDGNNGLWLSPHIDKIFDNGWITFSDEGRIITNSKQVTTIIQKWGIDPTMSAGSFNTSQRNYLKFHRKMFGFDETF